VLAFAAACSDTATSPTSVGRPLFAVAAGSYPTSGAVTTLNAGGAPSGAHFQAGTSALCTVTSTAIICTSTGDGTYQINGVGNKDATADLNAQWSATVDCTNNGGQLVEVKATTQSAPATTGNLTPDNGHLTVPQLSVSRPTDEQFKAAAKCPNKNWDKSLAPGDPTLESFTYTLKFRGISTPAISISAS
jgi:hypothetical protein